MIDTIDQNLMDWVSATAAGVDVTLKPVHADPKVPTACLHLLHMETAVPTRQDGPKPVELTLRYLVTTRAASVQEAHRVLGELLFTALDSREFQVDLEPLTIQTWQALGLSPQPAFRITVPMVKERPRPQHLIRETVVPSLGPLSNVTGIVLGPEDRPVSNARIRIAQTSLATKTDRSGTFTFRTTKSFIHNRELLVSARGHTQTVSANFTSGAPMLIRFNPQEN